MSKQKNIHEYFSQTGIMSVHVGKRIEALMKWKGVSSKEISNWLGIGESAVSKLLDRPNQKTDHLYSLSQNTGIPVEVFVTERDMDLPELATVRESNLAHVPRRSLIESEVLVARLEERNTLLQARIDDKEQMIYLLKSPQG